MHPRLGEHSKQIHVIQSEVKSLDSHAKMTVKNFDTLMPLMLAKQEGMDLRESVEKMILAQWRKDFGNVYALNVDLTSMRDT